MFKVGDRVKIDLDSIRGWEPIFVRNIKHCMDNDIPVYISGRGILSQEKFTLSSTGFDKAYYLPWEINQSVLILFKNDGKVRFTYTEVPSGTEYSYFLSWSRRHK